MTETYIKKDKDTLTVTKTTNETHIVEEDRVDIQTKLDHKELDKVELQREIDELKAKIAELDK